MKVKRIDYITNKGLTFRDCTQIAIYHTQKTGHETGFGYEINSQGERIVITDILEGQAKIFNRDFAENVKCTFHTHPKHIKEELDKRISLEGFSAGDIQFALLFHYKETSVGSLDTGNVYILDVNQVPDDVIKFVNKSFPVIDLDYFSKQCLSEGIVSEYIKQRAKRELEREKMLWKYDEMSEVEKKEYMNRWGNVYYENSLLDALKDSIENNDDLYWPKKYDQVYNYMVQSDVIKLLFNINKQKKEMLEVKV